MIDQAFHTEVGAGMRFPVWKELETFSGDAFR